MQWSLFVLILMGQCTFCVCRYEYHFVEGSKNWTEAQQYCRDHHTDLATVSDMTDVDRLRAQSAQYEDGVWIGLYNDSHANRTWHWSLPGVKFDEERWAKDEPNDKNHFENCVRMEDGRWEDVDCPAEHEFICYDEKKNNFRRITTEMSWPQAQKYCRVWYTDLISGLEQLNELKEFSEMSASGSSKEWWIGLFRDRWKWSDESNSSFRQWNLDKFKDEEGKACAMTLPNGNWSSDHCNKTKPFFCYDDKVILIKKEKNWTDALNYCRKNHHDLVSITNHNVQKLVQKKAEMARTTHVWLGMRFTCTLDLWFWVNDNLVCYENWAPGEKTEGCDMAAAMSNDGKWFKKRDNEEFNFVCALK